MLVSRVFVSGAVLCLVSCAADPVKPTQTSAKPLATKKSSNQTAQHYTAWFLQHTTLKALSFGEEMVHTRVLEAKPCQIVDVYLESSSPNKSSALTDVTYDSKKRLSRVLRKSKSATQTTTLTYTDDRLTSVVFLDVSPARTWTTKTTFLYDDKGSLIQQTHATDGVTSHTTKLTYDEASRTVNINKINAKTGKSTSSQVILDTQWRVKSASNVKYTYSPDHIALKSKTVEHDIFLKEGVAQRTRRVTNVVVGETAVSAITSGEMTYQRQLLTQFKRAIHTKRTIADKMHKSDSVHTKKLIYSCPES